MKSKNWLKMGKLFKGDICSNYGWHFDKGFIIVFCSYVIAIKMVKEKMKNSFIDFFFLMKCLSESRYCKWLTNMDPMGGPLLT